MPKQYLQYIAFDRSYMPRKPWLTRLMYSHRYANVALVDQMRELIEKTHQLENVVTIANPINTQGIHEKSNEEERSI
jgi:N-acetylgalactosamine-N,N'-diacetylbacillosaminyl-diphospho-undecaprenol 4-alpha-N-acetylgalactosaminyltransferase